MGCRGGRRRADRRQGGPPLSLARSLHLPARLLTFKTGQRFLQTARAGHRLLRTGGRGTFGGAAFGQMMPRHLQLPVETGGGLARFRFSEAESAAFLHQALGLGARAAFRLAQFGGHGLRLVQHGAQRGEAHRHLGRRQGCGEQDGRGLGREARQHGQKRGDFAQQPCLFGPRLGLGRAGGFGTAAGGQGGALGRLHAGGSGDALSGEAAGLGCGLTCLFGGLRGTRALSLGGAARTGCILR